MDAQEERLVAELENYGVRYLSRQADVRVGQGRPPARFLADLVRQPSSRVRTALIAALLAHPDLADAVPSALTQLEPENQLCLKLLYTAAVVLQKEHAGRLRPFLADRWRWLPDLYSTDLGLSINQSPDKALRSLGSAHQQKTGMLLNWSGTYENVAHHLLHRWELEQQWNQ